MSASFLAKYSRPVLVTGRSFGLDELVDLVAGSTVVEGLDRFLVAVLERHQVVGDAQGTGILPSFTGIGRCRIHQVVGVDGCGQRREANHHAALPT